MARKKQVRPHRSGGVSQGHHDRPGVELNGPNAFKTENNDEVAREGKPFFIDLDRSNWNSDEHFDISEALLTNLCVSGEFYGYKLSEEFYRDSKYYLRFRINNVGKFLGRMKLGHWPVLSASNVHLEYIEKRILENLETGKVIVSGNFDGPDEAVSGLVQLANLKFLTLRPIMGVTFSEDLSALRFRIEIQRTAFNACESLLDNTRQLWKRSMMSVMDWLRPELMTSEYRYGCSVSAGRESSPATKIDRNLSSSWIQARFDATGFYEAIKPSKEEPMLEDHFPDFLPELRPYQRRAIYWMLQREKGIPRCLDESDGSKCVFPLCVPLNLIDTNSRMFYNPFSGNVSLHPEYSSPHVFGGILADEMGLGKTVELLACVFAHRKSASDDVSIFDDVMHADRRLKNNLTRLKRERVECTCGAVTESSKYKGLWVQCDICDAWQHAECVGYLAKKKTSRSRADSKVQRCTKTYGGNSQKHSRTGTYVEVIDGTHVCPVCSELIQATDSPVPTGATLIVCPAPILLQWHAEIIRHTKPGSLKTCVYEGVRNTSLSNTDVTNIGELLTSDIVLTTYDVLKEDLSHDSDRHEGDRHHMRFEKRYPVIPTLLTRVFWWRICLDEAQMVESNTAAATEMALRLHAKYRWCVTGTPIQRKLDDLYGLLRFLKASPFDVLRWWIDAIKDPYEKGDPGAMAFTHNFFRRIMWRSSKMHVAEELQLPPQEECITWLNLSPIEEHFYQRQHETCVLYAREVIESVNSDILGRKDSDTKSSDPFVTHVEAAKLLNSLLKLRQACCHPQVGSSGLRTLQQSPMTMDEILSVLISKTKVEGEEALRKIVSSLNGLAGIAVIKHDFPQAISLYKEALALATEHAEDFRLDPLLNIHIHHNLAETLQFQLPEQFQISAKNKATKAYDVEECDQCAVKRRKISIEGFKLTGDSGNWEIHPHVPSQSASEQDLRMACENLKQKFLTVFYSRLVLAQQEFKKSYGQVCNALKSKVWNGTWWLEALHHIEQNKDSSSELIRKIEEAISGTLNTSRTSKLASCFRSITTLKYYIQTGMDSLKVSRETLLDRLLDIDQTIGNPREEDIDRVRYCPNCQANGDGLICVHCELDELFQLYEAKLFRLNKVTNGKIITSAEEAVDLQRKKSALNRFYWALSSTGKVTSSKAGYEDNGTKRDAADRVTVSKSPSELEVVLGIIKTYSRTLLGREDMLAATNQLLLLEGMRKEYAQARSLALAQAQVLCAHDEIKMAISRLRLKENDNDKSINALSEGELDVASAENSSEKFVALSALSCIKGQLRYLKGLVLSKQSVQPESSGNLALPEAIEAFQNSEGKENRSTVKTDDEACPVCQEKLTDQKMVFKCGHMTCCKCLFAMTEQKLVHHGKIHDKWIMCPTCRQHTDFGNIAYAVDQQNKSSKASMETCENSEASVTVQGSYGTKIEAITRRILWITTSSPAAKVLVFSSWNDVLDVLEHSFTANGISYIRMKGGRKSQVAISHFGGQKSCVKENSKRHDGESETKPIQVLLLLIQHGANGLNLLEAQHVILVEPLLNPAAEAQAISRIHRIGQENKTLVHRFIVKRTVEESIFKLNESKNRGIVISGNTKNQDQSALTLKDIESLFNVAPSREAEETDEKPSGSLTHLPPSEAAAIAAERRLMENKAASAANVTS